MCVGSHLFSNMYIRKVIESDVVQHVRNSAKCKNDVDLMLLLNEAASHSERIVARKCRSWKIIRSRKGIIKIIQLYERRNIESKFKVDDGKRLMFDKTTNSNKNSNQMKGLRDANSKKFSDKICCDNHSEVVDELFESYTVSA